MKYEHFYKFVLGILKFWIKNLKLNIQYSTKLMVKLETWKHQIEIDYMVHMEENK